MAAPRRGQLAPCKPKLGATGRLPAGGEVVEQVELVRRPCEPPLLELARHRDQALAGGGEILARRAPAPGVRAGAAVPEDAPREHEAVFVLRPQLGQRRVELVEEAGRRVELRLDVGLPTLGADERCVASVPEEEADGLREDRLARAGLAGDGVQARREGQLGFADEHQVFDPETPEHGLDGTPKVGIRRPARTAVAR